MGGDEFVIIVEPEIFGDINKIIGNITAII